MSARRGRAARASAYVLAVVAPVAAAVVTWSLLQVLPVPQSGFLVLLVVALLAYRLPPRPVRVAYMAGLVAILLPLLAPSRFVLPPEAAPMTWVTFAGVTGVVTYLVGQLHRQNQQLDHLDKLKATFIGLANHELRTPVAVLHASLDILAEDLADKLDASQRSFLEAARTSSAALAYIVQVLTAFESLERGPRPSRLPATPLKATVETTIAELNGIFERHGVQLDVHVEPAAAARSVPHTYVRLILQQLLSNAAKFNSPGGQALLDAHLEDDTLVLTVEDDGWGIPPGQRETIFESFYQPSDVLKRPSGGLGLGLALVRVAVQTLEGSIELESEPGAGSRFVVRLPVEAPLSAA